MIENDQEVTRHSVDETNESTKMTALNFFLENFWNSSKLSKFPQILKKFRFSDGDVTRKTEF